MRLLFAEDDKELLRAVKTLLERAGHTVDAVYDGEEAVEFVQTGEYDGIILDWMMPKLSGIEALKRIRGDGNFVPCLILTARDAVEDRVIGLDAGADDYLSKPFAVSELLARVRAMLRRKTSYAPSVCEFYDISLDTASMELKHADKSVRLNNKAFQLMQMFIEQPNTILTISRIMDKIWGWDADAETSVVWVNVSFLRKKLAEIGSKAQIKVSRGAGYVLEYEK